MKVKRLIFKTFYKFLANILFFTHQNQIYCEPHWASKKTKNDQIVTDKTSLWSKTKNNGLIFLKKKVKLLQI